jgi:hypothetical protein
MLELPSVHFDRVIPLFDTTQPNSTMIFSTLAGRTLGRAFVDHLDNPSNCLLVMDFQRFSFTHANVDQKWLNETVATLRPELDIFLNWSPHMPGSLQPPGDFSRIYAGHEFMEFHAQGDLRLPPDRHLRRIDAELFARCTWHNLMLEAFGTVDHFLANGIGMCVMDGDEICSEAYAVFLGAGKFEIGIVTNEKYRKQGNAYLACKALLPVVEETGYPPHWSYFENNVGSDATARKLGFGALRDYQWYYYPQLK